LCLIADCSDFVFCALQVAKLLPKLKTFERDRARFDPTQALKD
jgi:hypothetical protein